jgi:hypothetical protein
MLKTIRTPFASILLLASACAFAQPALNAAVSQDTLKSTICTGGYSQSIRPAQAEVKALKLKVMADAGKTLTDSSSFQLHRIIPMELGGSASDLSNLELRPLVFEKSALGIHLQKTGSSLKAKVCSGKMSLADAQKEMLHQWEIVQGASIIGD